MIAAYCLDPIYVVQFEQVVHHLYINAAESRAQSLLHGGFHQAVRGSRVLFGDRASGGMSYGTSLSQLRKHWRTTKLAQASRSVHCRAVFGSLALFGDLASWCKSSDDATWYWCASAQLPAGLTLRRSPLIGPTTVVSSPLTNSRCLWRRGQGDEVGLPTSTWDHPGTLHTHLGASLNAVYEPSKSPDGLATSGHDRNKVVGRRAWNRRRSTEAAEHAKQHRDVITPGIPDCRTSRRGRRRPRRTPDLSSSVLLTIWATRAEKQKQLADDVAAARLRKKEEKEEPH
ncbi:hypothetical protein PG984_007785 [Apiospora sp. TS-2023a]